MKIFWLAILSMISLRAQAAANGCGFVPRETVSEMMSELPPEVIGWVSCYEKHPKVGIFLVVKTSVAQNDFVLDHAKSSVPDGSSWKFAHDVERAPGYRELVLETKRGISEPMFHYSFSAPSKAGGIFFVHAQSARETRMNWKTLTALRSDLTSSEMVARILSKHTRGAEIARAISGKRVP